MDLSMGVATIGETDHQPGGIGTVQIEWKDNKGCVHKYKLKMALYFLILLSTLLALLLWQNNLKMMR
eukprot:402144-Ditylum_brightwellii.AAC.1